MRFLTLLGYLLLAACSTASAPHLDRLEEPSPLEGQGGIARPEGQLVPLDGSADAGLPELPSSPATAGSVAPPHVPPAGGSVAPPPPATPDAGAPQDSGSGGSQADPSDGSQADPDAGSPQDSGTDSGQTDSGDAGPEPEPCPAEPDAYEPNDQPSSAALVEAIAGDSGGRSVGSTFHPGDSRDYFSFPILERTHTGPVRVSWEVQGAVPAALEVHCPYSAVTRCDGGVILGSTYRYCMLPVAGLLAGEAVVECSERPTVPEPISVLAGIAPAAEGCRPSVAVSQEAAQ